MHHGTKDQGTGSDDRVGIPTFEEAESETSDEELIDGKWPWNDGAWYDKFRSEVENGTLRKRLEDAGMKGIPKMIENCVDKLEEDVEVRQEELRRRSCEVCSTYMREEIRCGMERRGWPCGALICSMRCKFEHERRMHAPQLGMAVQPPQPRMAVQTPQMMI